MINRDLLRIGLKAGGAPIMWERTILDALHSIGELVPSGSRVLEIGYGDGLLTCYLCRELGWRITGLEVSRASHRKAVNQARECGLSECIEFQHCRPDETRKYHGQYDAVFIKTVLYSSSSVEEYMQWLDWILTMLRPGGVLIDFETGRANSLTQWYRVLRGRKYVDSCLYTSSIEKLYDDRFSIVYRRYYGGWSQFLSPIPWLYFIASRAEERMEERHADNSFIVAIIAQKSA